ncbi:MAG TPA: SDR family oxidoreductase [Sporichthya sp.]|nr:SDR family oxidoreductase [Sporichthya sp.]
MTMDLTGTPAVVTGASRGFGRAIALALHQAGADVVAVARDGAALAQLRTEVVERLTTVSADVTDPVVAGRIVERYRPRTLVLNAGAAPLMRPLQEQSWESFSRVWQTDVQQVFHWTREALLFPLAPSSTVIAMSSGAALFGSPLSGGYAGAKAMVRFLTGYAAAESDAADLGIRFVSLLPQLTPQTDLGAMAVAAYARREGLPVEEKIGRLGTTLRPDDVGKQIAELAAGDLAAGAYLVTPDGLKEIS